MQGRCVPKAKREPDADIFTLFTLFSCNNVFNDIWIHRTKYINNLKWVILGVGGSQTSCFFLPEIKWQTNSGDDQS